MAAFASGEELSVVMQRDVPVAQANLALDSVSAEIRHHCGWSISAEAVSSLILTAPGGWALWLPTRYLTAVTSLTEEGATLVDGTDFEWEQSGRLTRLGACWSTKPRAIVVSFTHGYPANHVVLADLKGLALAAAARSVDNPTGLRSESIDDHSWTAAGDAEDTTPLLSKTDQMRLAGLVA